MFQSTRRSADKPPLSMPDPERLPELEALRAYDALRLFAERAVSARPGFTVTAQNGAQVAQVDQALDISVLI